MPLTIDDDDAELTAIMQTRGLSDSSAALTASQISGGGCIPPPTPEPPMRNVVGHAIAAQLREGLKYQKTKPIKHHKDYETTTHSALEGGLGKILDSDEVSRVPKIEQMGTVMKNGRAQYVLRERATGDSSMWETSSMASNVVVRPS